MASDVSLRGSLNRFVPGYRFGHHRTVSLRGVILLQRIMWSNLVLGLWLMTSPFALVALNRRVLGVLWEDLLLGFGIATFSLCRLLTRKQGEIAFMDWLITLLGILTLINPFLYSYFNVSVAAWNNLVVGGIVFLLAIYQDWKDSDKPAWHQHHRQAHP